MAELRLIELAQQGDPQAIAALMNQSLHPKGMTATVERQGDALEVRLEADRVPNRQALTAFVEKGIHNLGLESIRSIRILGQQTGASFPAWMQELYLEVSPADSIGDVTDQLMTEAGSLGDSSIPSQFSAAGSSPDVEPYPAETNFADETAVQGQSDLESIWNEQEQTGDFLHELFGEESESSQDVNRVSPEPTLPDGSSDLTLSDPWTDPSQPDTAASEPAAAGILDDLFADSPTDPATTDETNFEAAAIPMTSVDDLLSVFDDEPDAGAENVSNIDDRPSSDEFVADLFAVDESADEFNRAIDSVYVIEEYSIETSDPTGIDALFGDASFEETPEAALGEPQNSDFNSLDSTDALADLFAAEASLEDPSLENVEAPVFTEEVILIEETIIFDSSDDLAEGDTSEDIPTDDETSLSDEAAMFDLFAEEAVPGTAPDESADDALDQALLDQALFGAADFAAGTDLNQEAEETVDQGMDEANFAIDETFFAVASEPIDVDRLEFGISESEALDANLMEEPGVDSTAESSSEQSAESIDFLDELATEAEMSPEVTLQDQWLEPTPSEESTASDDAVAGELGLEGFAPEGFAAASEQDMFAQEFPSSPELSSELMDFPSDLFPGEPSAESTGSQSLEGEIEESTMTAEPIADFGEVGDSEAMDLGAGATDENLDLSNWFANPIESGDPAAELSTAPSEDFLTREDLPSFTSSEDADPTADAAAALFSDVPPEPSFTPEAPLPDELTFGDTSENATDEFASANAEIPQSEFSQQQFDAQINLFADEADSVTEDSFQNSWELQTDDISDDSADAEDWRSSLAFSLDQSAYPEEEAALPDLTEQPGFPEASDLEMLDFPQQSVEEERFASSDADPSMQALAADFIPNSEMPAEDPSLSNLTFDDEVTIAHPDLADSDSPDLAVLTDMPGIDLPDDQMIPASDDPFFAGTADFENDPFETTSDEPADVSLANTLSLSEAMNPDQLVDDLQADDLQDNLQDNSLEMSLNFQHDPIQEDYGDLTALEEPPLPEELTDEQLQELLGTQSDYSATGDFALEDSSQEAAQQPLMDPFGDFDLDPVSEPSPDPTDLSTSGAASPDQEPLLDFLNRQFGLEDEMPTLEETPEQSPEPTAEALDDREIVASTEYVAEPQPTQLPFAATPFAAASIASSSEAPEPDLSLDLSDEWLESSVTEASVESEPVSSSSTEYSERQEQSQEELERQLASSDFVQTQTGNEPYYPAESSGVPPREVVSSSASRPASNSNGLFTIVLFSIVGFIAALLGFSLWSELSAPPEPQPAPAPTAPPSPQAAPPPAPTAPPADPAAAPPVPPESPAASPVAPPPAAPVAPPEASPVPPAPVAPPPDAPAPPAAPASP